MKKPQAFSQLTNDVEDLLGRIADIKVPDVQAVRARVSESIKSTKSALKNASATASDTIMNAATTTDGYVRDNPWAAVAAVAGLAAIAGFIAGRVTAPK